MPEGQQLQLLDCLHLLPRPPCWAAAEQCLLEWEGEGEPPLPLLKDMFASERRKAKVRHQQLGLFDLLYDVRRHAGQCSASVPGRQPAPAISWGQAEASCVPYGCMSLLLTCLVPSCLSPRQVLNFSIAYGKTAHGLSKDWKVTIQEAEDTVKRWYESRPEVGAGAGGAAAMRARRWGSQRQPRPQSEESRTKTG